jgi:hypothetical protein
MKQILAIIITIGALSAFGQKAPSRFTCTSDIATGTDCAVVNLQIATAGATELRTWPGTDHNYQKAQAEWSAVDDRLRLDIASRDMTAYRRHILQLAWRGPVRWSNAAHLFRLSFKVHRLPDSRQAVQEIPTARTPGIQTCNAVEYRKAVAAGSSTEYDLAAKLNEQPCAISVHSTREDALLYWGRAYQLLSSIDANVWQPWYLNQTHTAHQIARHDAFVRSISTLDILRRWESSGTPPSRWREEIEAFASAVDRSNTGPGRMVMNDRYGWISASAVYNPSNGRTGT